MSDLDRLKESVEFIRLKYKRGEPLSFCEISEALDILHYTSQTTRDAYVDKVVKKNVPYLQKLLKKAMDLEYKKTLGKCLDLTVDSITLDGTSYSGILDYKISMIEEELVILLNSHREKGHIIIVPIQNARLEIESLSVNDQEYVTDMIDMTGMIDILNKHSVEYLHICETYIYRMIDDWDCSKIK